MTTNVYHFERDNFEYQLKAFASREISFRVQYLSQSYASIAADAGADEDGKYIAASTVKNLVNGTTKHPQARTLFRILMALGFEFDMISSELRETNPLTVNLDGNVVPLRKKD